MLKKREEPPTGNGTSCTFEVLVDGIVIKSIDLASIPVNETYSYTTDPFTPGPNGTSNITQQVVCLPDVPLPQVQAAPGLLIAEAPVTEESWISSGYIFVPTTVRVTTTVRQTTTLPASTVSTTIVENGTTQIVTTTLPASTVVLTSVSILTVTQPGPTVTLPGMTWTLPGATLTQFGPTITLPGATITTTYTTVLSGSVRTVTEVVTVTQPQGVVSSNTSPTSLPIANPSNIADICAEPGTRSPSPDWRIVLMDSDSYIFYCSTFFQFAPPEGQKRDLIGRASQPAGSILECLGLCSGYVAVNYSPSAQECICGERIVGRIVGMGDWQAAVLEAYQFALPDPQANPESSDRPDISSGSRSSSSSSGSNSGPSASSSTTSVFGGSGSGGPSGGSGSSRWVDASRSAEAVPSSLLQPAASGSGGSRSPCATRITQTVYAVPANYKGGTATDVVYMTHN